MTDKTDNLLEPKINRSPSEVGQEIFRLARKHGELHVELGESEWDIKVTPVEEE